MSTYITRRPQAANVIRLDALEIHPAVLLVSSCQIMFGVRAVEYLAKSFPPITGIRWFNLSVLVITPALSLYGLFQVPILTRTVIWTALYYIFSMLGKP